MPDASQNAKQSGGIFGMLDEEDRKRLANFGQAAAAYAQQPLQEQMVPMQFGGGLLQMIPAPQLQMGQGIMGYQPSPVNAGERDAAFIEKMRKLLGLPA